MLDDAASEIGATLEAQRERLAARIADLQRLEERLATMAEAHEHGIPLSPDEQETCFGPDWDPHRNVAERHREVFGNFFPITRQMQVCLGRMFEADPGFAAHYDGIRDGLASWFRQTVDEAARTHGIDPDLATWR